VLVAVSRSSGVSHTLVHAVDQGNNKLKHRL
jgi:hypothetical protein